jgi:hypothetical protein
MSATVSVIHLLDLASGNLVEARLHDRIEDHNLNDWETKWRPVIEATVKRLADQKVPASQWPQSAHWDWRQKIEDMKGLLSGASFCIECEAVTQGMMALNVAKGRARIEQQKGQHLVHVEYLEAAPWNRSEHVAKPRFRGVGSILMYAAIALSQSEGFKGRIGLHALPQSHVFYADKCGMTDLGPDPKYQDLHYFEMTVEQAERYLRGEEKS